MSSLRHELRKRLRRKSAWELLDEVSVIELPDLDFQGSRKPAKPASRASLLILRPRPTHERVASLFPR